MRRTRRNGGRRGVAIAAVTALAAALTFAAGPVRAQNAGKADYIKNCAGCHGADGKGQGRDLYVVNVKPKDLTLLAKKNGGVFPFQQVEDSIDGRRGIPSHKRFDMPFWGVTFQEPGKEFTPESEAKAKQRIDGIVRFIQTVQQR
jgi:mono/diheme cytochrome c family protein